MAIQPKILDSVGFIGLPKIGENGSPSVCWGGTCFFIEEPVAELPEKIWGYLVTARHVAERVAYKDFFVRLNLRDGGSYAVPVPAQSLRWWCHPEDNSVDIALARWLPPEDLFKCSRWSVRDFVTASDLRAGKYGIGDDIHAFGLFRPIAGQAENMPVVRSGVLAMIPSEPIPTGLGPAEVNLVEMRSVGGLSGSPVIVTPTMMHTVGSARVKGIGTPALLGVMAGHWDLKESDDQTHEADNRYRESGHSGISVVSPAQKIIEILGQADLTELKVHEQKEL